PVLLKHGVKLYTSVQTNMADLVQEVTLLWQNKGNVLFEDDSGQLCETPWPPPFEKGYTNALYSARFTNLRGSLVPLVATLTSFVPDLHVEKSPPRLLREESYSLQVSNVVPGCRDTDLIPQLRQVTFLTDARLADLHPTFHPTRVLSNGQPWKVVSMTELAKEYDEYIQQCRRQVSRALRTGYQVR